MATNGRALRAVGIGVAFSNVSSANLPLPFVLDPGSYVVTCSQVDVTAPATATLTDNFGNTFDYNSHNQFPLTVGSPSQSPWKLTVVGGTVDNFAVKSESVGAVKYAP
jgi:hypothetical protein